MDNNKQRFPSSKLSRGFSLIETTLALAVAGGTMMTLLALVPSGLEQMRVAARDTSTARVLQMLNAHYQVRSWASISSGDTFYYDNQGAQVKETDPYASFGAKVTLQPTFQLPGSPVTNPHIYGLRIVVTDRLQSPSPFAEAPGVTVHHLTIAEKEAAVVGE